ncbi:hypothetical protein CTAYLR_004541 [Chrysophaeum taylorii]|uniref:Diaminopimelate decarboxylase n=1 Tax=Chrysophaeum taylorii TaxID=2483200 RepID=A0AAD7XRH1_9STRA|nr:hypothetical protein CTAYLR_004541 [Chrysophaeum taylorii]
MGGHREELRFLSPSQTAAVRDEFGTPCYVYDAKSLRLRAEEALAFPNAFGLTVRYAMKACPNGAILKLFDSMGLEFDASSTHEAQRAVRLGIEPSKISLSTQQLDDDGFKDLVKLGVEVNACSLSQLEKFGKAFPGGRVGIRFNPGLGSGGNEKTNVGGPGSSFGIWHGEFDAVVDVAAQHGLAIERVHTHIGSGSDPEVWQRVAKLSLGLCERLGPSVSKLNLGGGYKVGRMSYETSTDLQRIGEPVRDEVAAFAERTGTRLRLEIEPGTFLVANAGSLVCTVQDVVSTRRNTDAGRDFLKLDCGMTDILRPSLYGSQHPIVVVPTDDDRRNTAAARDDTDYVVVGHCCESGDLLTPAPDQPDVLAERTTARATPGDLAVIESVGAYCSAMAAKGYNSFPEPPEVLLNSDGHFHLIRRRSTLDQLTQNELLPEPAALL